jgi:23S rRNA pseudouridine1911/1915/1917 synthase
MRLDKYLAEKYKEFSRTNLQKLIKEGKVLVNGKKVRPHYKIQEDDDVKVEVPEEIDMIPKPEKIKLDVIFENKDLLIIDKPSGMVVHPSEEGHHMTGSLVNAILNDPGQDNLSNIGGELRPGIIHRLDKDTSGLLMIAKNNKIHRQLIDLMKNRKVNKFYYALLLGRLEPNEGTIDAPLSRGRRDFKRVVLANEGEGRDAITKYEVEDYFEYEGSTYTLIKAKILTGRTHQIRVHFSSIGHPVVGDPVYGNRKINSLFKKNFGLNRYFLHAAELSFELKDGTEIDVKKELPKELKSIIDEIPKA